MERTIHCRWERGETTLGMDEAGNGSSVVLLPALSSISTRREMHPLFESLQSQFQLVTVDGRGLAIERARETIGRRRASRRSSTGS